MKYDLYFENVPNIDLLFIEQILFSYEYIPIVFVCVDKNKNRYLCVCDDIIDEESWLIVKIENAKLLEILNDKDTVLSAFVNQKVIIANRKFNQDIQYDITEYSNINKEELPVSDQYLEMKDSLKTYIEKIAFEILCTSLKLPPSFYDMSDDNLDISRVVISVKKMSISERYNTFPSNNDTEDFANSLSSDLTSIKINCQKTSEESITLSKETVLIAYAA